MRLPLAKKRITFREKRRAVRFWYDPDFLLERLQAPKEYFFQSEVVFGTKSKSNRIRRTLP